MLRRSNPHAVSIIMSEHRIFVNFFLGFENARFTGMYPSEQTYTKSTRLEKKCLSTDLERSRTHTTAVPITWLVRQVTGLCGFFRGSRVPCILAHGTFGPFCLKRILTGSCKFSSGKGNAVLSDGGRAALVVLLCGRQGDADEVSSRLQWMGVPRSPSA